MCLRTSARRGEAGRRHFVRTLTRSRAISNAKFCGREKFSKFSVRIERKIARNLARRCSPATLGTCLPRKEPPRRAFRRDRTLTRFRTENFAAQVSGAVTKRKTNHNPKRTENSAWRAKCRNSTKLQNTATNTTWGSYRKMRNAPEKLKTTSPKK